MGSTAWGQLVGDGHDGRADARVTGAGGKRTTAPDTWPSWTPASRGTSGAISSDRPIGCKAAISIIGCS